MRRAVDSGTRSGLRESMAQTQAIAALHEALVGNSATARQLASAAISQSASDDTRWWVALTCATTGDTARADSLIAQLEKSSRLDTIANNYRLPTLKASIKLAEHKPSESVTLLEFSLGYEFRRIIGRATKRS